MEETFRHDLQKEFDIFLPCDWGNSAILDNAVRVAKKHDMNVRQFVEEYILFSYPDMQTLTVESIVDFDKAIENGQVTLASNDEQPKLDERAKLTEETKLHESSFSSYADLSANISSDLLSFYGIDLDTTLVSNSRAEVAIDKVVCKFGTGKRTDWKWNEPRDVDVAVYNEDVLLSAYRYMYQKNNEVIEEVSKRIEEYSRLIKDSIDESKEIYISPFCLGTNERLYIGGQLFSIVDKFSLDPDGVRLQEPIGSGRGTDVLLDLNQVAKASLFPGQIVVAHGVCSRNSFSVSRLYEGVTPPRSETPITSTPRRLNVYVAAGPFSSILKLDLTPLDDLIELTLQSKPDLVILVGPFFSDDIKNVSHAQTDKTFEKIFSETVLKHFQNLTNAGITVLVISSPRDPIAEPIYPCPPYQMKNLIDKLHLHADPSLLIVDQMIFAITSTDVLNHLGSEELFKGRESVGRVDRLLRHLLLQRSFYPMYPAKENFSVDVVASLRYCKLPVLPNIFIMPSDMQCFVKNIDGCVFVNPGRCFRRNFVRMEINITGQDDDTFNISKCSQIEVVHY